jgi:hypothetical protein
VTGEVVAFVVEDGGVADGLLTGGARGAAGAVGVVGALGAEKPGSSPVGLSPLPPPAAQPLARVPTSAT